MDDMVLVFPGPRHFLSEVCFIAAKQPSETLVFSPAVRQFALDHSNACSSSFFVVILKVTFCL
jgi:hypothetical protein